MDLRDTNPDFVKLAEAYGAYAMRIFRDDEVDGAWEAAMKITDRPVFIDVIIPEEENVYPMIPAGAASHEMIEG